MLLDHELCDLENSLRHGEVSDVSSTLKSILEYPAGDRRILPILESMIEDPRPCIISLPYRVGEIRRLVAHVLLSERVACGINTPVHLPNSILPVSPGYLMEHAENAGIEVESGLNGAFKAFEALRSLGLLPTEDLSLP